MIELQEIHLTDRITRNNLKQVRHYLNTLYKESKVISPRSLRRMATCLDLLIEYWNSFSLEAMEHAPGFDYSSLTECIISLQQSDDLEDENNLPRFCNALVSAVEECELLIKMIQPPLES